MSSSLAVEGKEQTSDELLEECGHPVTLGWREAFTDRDGSSLKTKGTTTYM